MQGHGAIGAIMIVIGVVLGVLSLAMQVRSVLKK